MIQSRKSSNENTALGLEFCPLSLHSKLDQYTSNNKIGGGMSGSDLVDATVQAGIDPKIATNQISLYELAKSKISNYWHYPQKRGNTKTQDTIYAYKTLIQITVLNMMQ